MADWNAAIEDPLSGVGDIIFEITASPAVFCGDCGFFGGVHLEFDLQTCDDGLFCNGVETCDGQTGCQAGTEPCTNPLLPFCDEAAAACVACLLIGDVNGDEAIDLIDFEGFADCSTGPVGPADPPEYPPSCRCFDADTDGDIDLIDFQTFQRDFVGAKP